MTEQGKPSRRFLAKDLALAELAARRNSDKSWAKVDQILGKPGFCDDPTVLSFASKKLFSKNENVRDLAASIFEKSTTPLQEAISFELSELVIVDPNPYVRYRSAFALFSNGDRTENVILGLKDAAKDPDVSEIANGYLSQLK